MYSLDSRCRKKHHTEKLEEEKKQFIAIIDRLEDEERNWRLQEQRWLHERQQWHQYTENLVKEKEELVRQHTLETADLRRRNACLADEAQRLESVSMSAQPSSSGGSAGFPEFEHLTMDTSPFDDFSFIDTPIMDTDSKEERGPVRQRKAEGSPSVKNDDNKSAASGLLLMLLLCGAWVASNHSPSSPPTIPRMPDDVRVASSTILENIYKDAGLEFGHTSQSLTDQATTHQAGSLQSHETPSPLASLHNRLMAPTPLQQRDQVFSLTTEQYNRVTCDDLFDEEPEASPHPRRRNLGEALAAMRAEKPGPAGEVYTRSLMLNELPANVVRDFARMVAENGKLPGNGESIS